MITWMFFFAVGFIISFCWSYGTVKLEEMSPRSRAIVLTVAVLLVATIVYLMA
jgi:hypothetical protein